ncbi:hypothetical protein [Paludisphaera rhizosphaerae]|uniref:hypothetical protein n=1 Tax=Paludisphaera rhizosphaerae TaxID=2711216 RepID=UPI0013EA8E47|nr:hypothetical protein [Paludisphaera rhizosphaerae]
MLDALLPLAILALWIALFRWILPWMGIPTCMSGGCGLPPQTEAQEVPPRTHPDR